MCCASFSRASQKGQSGDVKEDAPGSPEPLSFTRNQARESLTWPIGWRRNPGVPATPQVASPPTHQQTSHPRASKFWKISSPSKVPQ